MPEMSPEPIAERQESPKTKVVTNLIRPDALVAREKALLHYKVKDGSSKLFELTSTFPWRLRRHSAFLSLHFGSLGLFAILLLGYSLLSMYPLGDCYAASEFKDSFKLQRSPAATGSEISCDGTVGEGRKKKPFDVGSAVLRMSLGSFCAGEASNGFSSSYDCSELCIVPTWEAGRPDEELCATMNPCPPPIKGQPKEGRRQNSCCTLQESDFSSNELPQSHVWIWVVAGMLMFCGWMVVLQYLQYSLAEAINLRNINVAQYAVLVSNVGNVLCDDQALEAYGRMYGDVVSAFYVRDFGRFFAKDTERGKTLELLKELRKLKSEAHDLAVEPGVHIQGRFSSFPGSWYLWLYERYLCGLSGVDDTLKKLELRYEALSQEVEDLSNQEHQSTGNAVIVFNWVPDAGNMLYEHNLRNPVANLFVPPFIGRSMNILTEGKFAKTRRMVLSSTSDASGQAQTTHRHVTVTRAPEPSDFMWENTRFGGWPIIKRRIVAWGLYVALLVVSFTVQYILTSLEQGAIRNDLKNSVCGRQDEGWKIPVLGWGTWTILKTAAVLLFSNLGIGLIHILSDYSLFLTYTHNVGSTVTKIAVFQLINSFAVPLIAIAGWSAFRGNIGQRKEDSDAEIGLWFSEGGFVTLGFLIQLTNAVFPSLAFLVRMDDILNLHFLSHMACTQKYVDQFTQPPEFRMNLRMGQAITTVGLAILYAPILPVSALIGLLGILVQYVVDQYMALRCSSRPRAFQVEAFYGANYLLRLLPLIQLILVLAFYFGSDKAGYASIVGLIIWGTACVVPLMNQLRQQEYAKWVEGGRPRLLDWARQPGEQAATVDNIPYQEAGGTSEGLWVNTSTYLPDVPTLEPEIFTKHVKPFFKYWDPAHERVKSKQRPPPGTTIRIDTTRYKHVQPNQEFTQALRAQRGPLRPPSTSGAPNPSSDETRLPTVMFTPDF